MLELVISIIQNICLIFGISLRALPLKGVTNKKKIAILISFYLLLLTVNVFYLTYNFYEKGTSTAFIKYNCLIVGIISTIFNTIVMRKRWREHIFIAGITMLCEYVILGVPAFLVPKMMPLDNIFAHTAFILMYGVMLAIIYSPLKMMLDKTVAPFFEIDKVKYWNILWYIPAILCISMFMMSPYEENLQNVSQLLSRVLMGIILIIICFSVVDERQKLLEKQVLSEQMNDSKVYYSGLQSKIEESRKVRHDLKHLLVSIRHYLETDDKTSLKEFCDSIENDKLVNEKIPYTGNGAVDGLLYHYINKAKELDIDFKYIGKINITGIVDMDLCVLLGNALDNAFAGCMTLDEKREVTLITQIEEETLSFVVKNTFDGKVNTSDDIILSRKRKNRQGVGLKSISTICEKYNGTMEVKWDNEHFVILMILTINDTNK